MKRETARASIKRDLVLCAAIVALVIALFFAFSKQNHARILRQNQSYVEDNAKQTADRLDEMLQSALMSVQQMAYWFAETLDAPQITPQDLQEMTEHSDFDYVRFADAQGINYAADGRTNNAADREYYLAGMEGDSGISVIMSSRITSETLINFYAPLRYEGQVFGVLRGVYLADKRMKELLNTSFFGVPSATFLCARDGSIIACSEASWGGRTCSRCGLRNREKVRVRFGYGTHPRRVLRGHAAELSLRSGRRHHRNGTGLEHRQAAGGSDGRQHQRKERAGKGLNVYAAFSFPVTGQVAALSERADGGDSTLLQGRRVLLAEDNELNLEIAQELLHEMGIQVLTARNGEEALSAVAHAKPGEIELILMDIQMPVLDGYDAARAIRALQDPALSRIPIVAMTANAFDEDRNNALACGMNGHIAKPIDVRSLRRVLCGLIGSAER